MASTTATNDFGKDLGLVHQVVVAGRDFGMDHTTWAILADKRNREILAQVAKFAKDSVKISERDLVLARGWIDQFGGRKYPYRGTVSYNCWEIDSGYSRFFQQLHEDLEDLFWKARYNEKARELCKELEILFVLAYIYSAIYAAYTDVNPCAHETFPWREKPLRGFFVSVEHLFEGDGAVEKAEFLTREHLRMNEAASAVREAQVATSAYAGRYIPRGQEIFWENFTPDEIRELCDITRGSRDNQMQKIFQLLEKALKD